MGQGRGGVQQAFASRLDASDSRQRPGRGPWRQLDRPVAPPAAPRLSTGAGGFTVTSRSLPSPYRAGATPGARQGFAANRRTGFLSREGTGLRVIAAHPPSITGGDTTAALLPPRRTLRAAQPPSLLAVAFRQYTVPPGALPGLAHSWLHFQVDRLHASSTGSSIPLATAASRRRHSASQTRPARGCPRPPAAGQMCTCPWARSPAQTCEPEDARHAAHLGLRVSCPMATDGPPACSSFTGTRLRPTRCVGWRPPHLPPPFPAAPGHGTAPRIDDIVQRLRPPASKEGS